MAWVASEQRVATIGLLHRWIHPVLLLDSPDGVAVGASHLAVPLHMLEVVLELGPSPKLRPVLPPPQRFELARRVDVVEVQRGRVPSVASINTPPGGLV